MKKFALYAVLAFPCCGYGQSEPAGTTAKILSDGYYIVVGSYVNEGYAQKFVERINQLTGTALYGLDARRNLFLVYLEQYSNMQESLRRLETTRRDTPFSDAWVKVIKNEPVGSPAQAQPSASLPTPVAVQEVTKPPVDSISSGKVVIEVPGGQVQKSSDQAEKTVEPAGAANVEQPGEPAAFTNTPVFIRIVNAQNSSPLDVEIEVVDTERSRSMQKIKGNEDVVIPDPKSKSGDLSLICDAFGFRKVQHEVNFRKPLSDSTKGFLALEEGRFVLNFELIRYQKGDVATLYNVYFYNDAAIMLPSSKFQLTSLLEMMRDNPQYTIMLHGHTNGNRAGKIISMGPSKDFFSVNARDVKEGHGSSKKLSEARAGVIRDWLISEGVQGERIEVKAWGGSKMIHDKNSVNAKQNVRVEVEVLTQ